MLRLVIWILSVILTIKGVYIDKVSVGKNFIIHLLVLNTCESIQGGAYKAPHRKMAITPKNNDPKEPKLCDFSYTSMTL